MTVKKAVMAGIKSKGKKENLSSWKFLIKCCVMFVRNVHQTIWGIYLLYCTQHDGNTHQTIYCYCFHYYNSNKPLFNPGNSRNQDNLNKTTFGILNFSLFIPLSVTVCICIRQMICEATRHSFSEWYYVVRRRRDNSSQEKCNIVPPVILSWPRNRNK